MLIIFHNINPLLGQMNEYPEKKDEKKKDLNHNDVFLFSFTGW